MFRNLSIIKRCIKCRPIMLKEQVRHKGYMSSNTEESPDKYTQVERSFNEDEWKAVLRALPPIFKAKPPSDPNIKLPSGWSPQKNVDYSWNVRRTSNYMIPAYIWTSNDGSMYTKIKLVEGNIWELEKLIGKYLQDLHPEKAIQTHVHEVARHVKIKGDYIEEVRDWLEKVGM